jgi:aerotaxis receptor
MRQNLPITQREYPFPPNRTLVSVTDLKGRITYCNPAFIEVSGYSREELLGIGQINEAVAHMDSITQQNAAMVEELASAARSLTAQVQGVSHSMRLFRLQPGERTLSEMDAVELRRQHKGG